MTKLSGCNLSLFENIGKISWHFDYNSKHRRVVSFDAEFENGNVVVAFEIAVPTIPFKAIKCWVCISCIPATESILYL